MRFIVSQTKEMKNYWKQTMKAENWELSSNFDGFLYKNLSLI